MKIIMPIFFDIDNTLLDDDYAVEHACSYLFNKYKNRTNGNFKNFLNIWHKSLQKNINLYLKGKITFEEQRLNRIRQVLKIDKIQMKDDEIGKIFDIYLKQYENNWKIFPDVKQCILELNNETLGIISNGNHAQQIEKLEKFNIRKFFKTIIISEKVGFSKPNPKIFEIACKSISVEPNKCIYIGDNLETDVLAGKKIGMHGIWLNRGKNKENWNNVTVIQNLKQLPKLLKKAAYIT